MRTATNIFVVMTGLLLSGVTPLPSNATPSYSIRDLGAVTSGDSSGGAAQTSIVSDGSIYVTRDNGLSGIIPHLAKISPDGTTVSLGSPITPADGFYSCWLQLVGATDSGQVLVQGGGQMPYLFGNPGVFKSQYYTRDAGGNYHSLVGGIPPTWTLLAATSINNTGQISALAVPVSDPWHTHLVALTPLPTTVSLSILLPSTTATTASRSQVQTWKVRLDGLSGAYSASWSVDSGQPNGMYDSQVGGAHKEAQVDMSGWTWRGGDGNGPYAITFTAKDSDGKVVGQQSMTVTLTK